MSFRNCVIPTAQISWLTWLLCKLKYLILAIGRLLPWNHLLDQTSCISSDDPASRLILQAGYNETAPQARWWRKRKTRFEKLQPIHRSWAI